MSLPRRAVLIRVFLRKTLSGMGWPPPGACSAAKKDKLGFGTSSCKGKRGAPRLRTPGFCRRSRREGGEEDDEEEEEEEEAKPSLIHFLQCCKKFEATLRTDANERTPASHAPNTDDRVGPIDRRDVDPFAKNTAPSGIQDFHGARPHFAERLTDRQTCQSGHQNDGVNCETLSS